MVTSPMLLREFFDEVTEFGEDKFFHCQAHGVFGAWGGEEDAAFNNPGRGAAHDGR